MKIKPFILLSSLTAGFSMHGFAEPNQPEIEETLVTHEVNQEEQDALTLPPTSIKPASAVNLGELLDDTPFLANSSYGQGAGRPVLKGLHGYHVGIFSNGLALQDISAASPDHATMLLPTSTSTLSVIEGPETLAYGEGYIGGVINNNFGRIHNKQLDNIQGQIKTSASTNDNGKSVQANIDLPAGNWVLHADGQFIQTDDYKSSLGTVANSDTETAAGNIALSYIDEERGYFGVSVDHMKLDYAVPNDEGHDARIEPESTTIQVEGAYNFNSLFFKRLLAAAAYTDYQHKELDDGLAEGFFSKEAYQLKTALEHSFSKNTQGQVGLDIRQTQTALCHSHDGCDKITTYNEPWDGTQGDHLEEEGGLLINHETPMPEVTEQNVSVFATQAYTINNWTFTGGLRVSLVTLSPDEKTIDLDARREASYYTDKDFSTLNASLQADWAFLSNQTLTAGLNYVERAPSAEALFYNGEHHATFSYQVDNPDLKKEKGQGIDLKWRFDTPRLSTEVAAFYYHYDSFIYNKYLEHDEDHEEEHHDEEGHMAEAEDAHHGEEDHHHEVVYQHVQTGANLAGISLSTKWSPFASIEPLAFQGFADYVLAETDSGHDKYLPRTPPASLALATLWETDHLFFQADMRHHFEQENVAENESFTKGYTTFNLQADYKHDFGKYGGIIGLRAANLTNKLGKNHVSYLKDYAPIQGRKISLDLGLKF